jgi:hypothetical protein
MFSRWIHRALDSIPQESYPTEGYRYDSRSTECLTGSSWRYSWECLVTGDVDIDHRDGIRGYDNIGGILLTGRSSGVHDFGSWGGVEGDL